MGTMKEIFTLQERNRPWKPRFRGTQSVHDYYSLGYFAIGQANVNTTNSRNERGASWFAVEGLQEVCKIVHGLKPEQMDKKQLDIALEEFAHEVQVNSGIDIQFRKMSQPSRSQVKQITFRN